MEMRLDKLLAKYGIGSRKEVKNYIRKGFVEVNGMVVKNDDFKVDSETDQVVFDGEVINYRPYVYLMLNKPQGYVCATKDNLHPTVLELIFGYENYDLFPVGRLDIDTEGLLLITNDGDFAHRLLAPSRHHSKLYYATVEGVMDDQDVQAFKEGIILDDGSHLQSANLKILETDDTTSTVTIEIFEGKFHQVKKMVASRGKTVSYLKRIAIKDLNLDRTLQLGDFRELSPTELVDLTKDL
ncbi:pseudouridine synthase [Thomasclavelia sp.]|uniref:pseudouridine synthase n=1 Tax=Thomasclavelia sp. TaxID=3025757 RepID=UPI0025EB2B85|nr:pseudouridine synthase [Thomasclavelia sp.]